ncbi:MAG: outer membrane protein assembly factor BamE [Woeseia sp.]
MYPIARFPSLLLLTLLLNACVYQPPLSQGNLLVDEDIEQIETGMTRGQVRFLLGTPMVSDPFHDERWDYVYYLRVGREEATFKRWVSVYFEEDKVLRVVKDRELNLDI